MRGCTELFRGGLELASPRVLLGTATTDPPGELSFLRGVGTTIIDVTSRVDDQHWPA